MRILVTGRRGRVGSALVRRLAAEGHAVTGFDLVDGHDVLHAEAMATAMHGCDAVVHLAALDEAAAGPSELQAGSLGGGADVFHSNVRGLANVLAAARQEGASRFVFMSSVDVFGCFLGQGRPAYLPIDDDHPVDPKSAYAGSKLAGEALLRAWTEETGAASVALRAPGVFTDAVYDFIRRAREEHPDFEWSPFWEYGAFIDVRDLADAVLAAVTAPLSGSHVLLVNATDISSAESTSAQLANRLVPDVPLHDRELFARDPYRALMDSSRARRVLSWSPRHRWRGDRSSTAEGRDLTGPDREAE